MCDLAGREVTGGSTRLDPDSPSRGAFSYPDYRRYWFASVALVFGLQFRFIAGAWRVHELTESPFWLGVPGIVSARVTIALLVPGGALADRVDCQRLLAWGRALTGLLNLAPRPSLASRCKPIRQIRYSRAERIRGLFFLSTRTRESAPCCGD